MVFSIAYQRINETRKTYTPTARIPVSCTFRSPPAAMHTARVPQTPANRCAEIAPTTSSTFSPSRSFIPATQMTPPTRPIMIAQLWATISGPAVIDTSPAIAPFRPASRSTRPSSGLETLRAAITPAAAARLVLTSTLLIATASAAPPRASCEPPLKPNQPSHKIKTPRVTIGTLEGGVTLMLPSARYFPSLGPTISAPASAAQPPVECTMVEPAKSWNPISLSQPPPQVQAPTIG